mgnify:CR=1 FL=1
MNTTLPGDHDRWVRSAAIGILALVAAWLLASLYLNRIELDDGYATIVNSQHFLGVTDGLFWQRGPMLAWLLMPAELLANRLGLHPLSVWPHHLTMALLHMAYLAGVWMLLKRHFGARLQTLLAFVAALPTVLFFSYAPFISHDLFPGVILLLMLILAGEQVAQPRRSRWLLLVALGTMMILVKQTYLLFWVAVCGAVAITLQLGDRRGRPSIIPVLQLCMAALASALIAWLVYSWVLRYAFGEHPLLLGPWLQYRGVVEYAQKTGPIDQTFSPWLYARNLSAYGYLAMSLALPGLVLCLRSGRALQQNVAIAWIMLAMSMQLLEFKEVRYLGYLAPLTAVLVATALEKIIHFRRGYLYAALIVLAADLVGATQEALRIREPYYREAMSSFLELFPRKEELRGQVFLQVPMSFISPVRHSFWRDRFHRITHVNLDQLRLLHSYDPSSVGVFEEQRLTGPRAVQPGDTVIFSNDVLMRQPPFQIDNRPLGLEWFSQKFTVAERITLTRVGSDYALQETSGQPVLLLGAIGVTQAPILIRNKVPTADVDSLRGTNDAPDRLSLLGFRVKAQCNAAGCRQFEP